VVSIDNDLAAPIAHLAKDPLLAPLVEKYGPLELPGSEDYFYTLFDAIASQQLSVKAAAAILRKVRALVPEERPVDAPAILDLPDEALRGTGFSWRKVEYVKDLSRRVASGDLDLAHIASLDDEEIIKQLVAVKGIGRWTAEMFLIFSLSRPDIFAVDDYGLQVGLKNLHGLETLPKPALMRELAEPWRPYRSYASLYLWRSISA
jgi:DNA-3-methyladenine glycosylase II